MDTLSTREARAFIAGMVLFSISAVCGACLMGYFCVKERKKRKKRSRAKAGDKGEELLVPDADEVEKTRSSF